MKKAISREAVKNKGLFSVLKVLKNGSQKTPQKIRFYRL